MKSNYHEKQEERRERYEERSDKLKAVSTRLYEDAKKMSDLIPFGQPILCGHHSEKRDRNYRDRIHNKFGKAFETDDKANYYAQKAASVGKAGISSDDPDAILKLEEKLEALEEMQEKMKAANKLIRKQDREGLGDLGFDAAQINELLTPDFAGRIGFPSYAFTNNSAEIRRTRQRIEQLKADAQREFKREAFPGGLVIEENPDENRVFLRFPGKPSEEFRTLLKRNGFKWAPSVGAWSRHLNNSGIWKASRIKDEWLKLQQSNEDGGGQDAA